MIIKFLSVLILFIIFNSPIPGNVNSHLVLAQEEEAAAEEDVEADEEESEEVESHLAIRKKKNIKKSQNGEPIRPKHVHTVMGADDDIILDLDN